MKRHYKYRRIAPQNIYSYQRLETNTSNTIL